MAEALNADNLTNNNLNNNNNSLILDNNNNEKTIKNGIDFFE